jgi:hypothetical protein
MELDDLAFTFIESGKAVKGLVQRNDVRAGLRRKANHLV